jgi:hypothetical protein
MQLPSGQNAFSSIDISITILDAYILELRRFGTLVPAAAGSLYLINLLIASLDQ